MKVSPTPPPIIRCNDKNKKKTRAFLGIDLGTRRLELYDDEGVSDGEKELAFKNGPDIDEEVSVLTAGEKKTLVVGWEEGRSTGSEKKGGSVEGGEEDEEFRDAMDAMDVIEEGNRGRGGNPWKAAVLGKGWLGREERDRRRSGG